MTITWPSPVYNRAIDPVELVTEVTRRAKQAGFVTKTRRQLQDAGISAAVAHRQSDRLYDWLIGAFSYQGVSDRAAATFISRHGNATYDGLAALFDESDDDCPKLRSFDAYTGCRFSKSSFSCAVPARIDRCLVPTLPLRKGQLNQAAVSLYLYIRDQCDGDLVGRIDQILAEADRPGHPDRLELMRTALTDDLRQVQGISLKLINMAFADLLIGTRSRKSRWFKVGSTMIAVDTLVHNFLHRTGILSRYGCLHRFGESCYGPNGCAAIIDEITRDIDCRQFSATYPAYFPRLIQHAIWRFCADAHLAVCNGRVIHDRARCRNRDCFLFDRCGRVTLDPA